MNTIQRIAKNTSFQLISNAITYLFTFFSVSYTASYLGVGDFGIISFALAFTGLFGIFSDLGLGTLIVRDIARDALLAPKYIGNIIVLKVILALVLVITIIISINLLGYPNNTIKVVYLICLYLILNSLTNVFVSVSQGFEKLEYSSIGRILSSILFLLGVMLAIKQGLGLLEFVCIYPIVALITLIYMYLISSCKFTKPKYEIDLSFWISAVKESWPFGLNGLFISIYIWADTIILSLMKGDEVVGWYSAAYRIILILLFIPASLDSSIFPIMSRSFNISENSLSFIVEKQFKYMVIISLPTGIGIALLSDRIISIFFGKDYIGSTIVLQILSFSLIFLFIRSSLERALQSSNRQRILTKMLSYCIVMNIIFNFIFINMYSYIGAAIAAVITDLCAFFLLFRSCCYLEYISLNKNLLGVVFNSIIACILMTIAIEVLYKFDIFLIILISAAVYFGTFLMLNGFDEEDKILMNYILKGLYRHVKIEI